MILKFGTLFSQASPWGQVLTMWARSVNEKSGGQLELQWFFGGQQGDETAMVGKCKTGQLDGCAVSGVGLGKIYKPILALQMPGLFSTWARLDAARNTLRGEFEQGLRTAGFHNLGWFDVGLTRPLSKGFAVRAPEDLRAKKPWLWRDDPTEQELYAVIGGVSGVPLNAPEVLPNLNTGAVNTLLHPAGLAEKAQWTSKLDHITDLVVGTAIGASVISSKTLQALPADLQAILTDTGKVASSTMTKRIRSEDDAAFGRLKTKYTVVAPTHEELATWSTTFRATRQKLAQGTFPAELVNRLEGMAG